MFYLCLLACLTLPDKLLYILLKSWLGKQIFHSPRPLSCSAKSICCCAVLLFPTHTLPLYLRMPLTSVYPLVLSPDRLNSVSNCLASGSSS